MMNIKYHVKNILKWVEWKMVPRKDTGKPCIFQPKAGNPGLFSYLVQVLGFVRYAHKNNLVPIIDLQTFENTYLSKEGIGKLNAWEHYFTQPAHLSLNDVSVNDCLVFDTTNETQNCQLKMPWWDWECYNQDSITCKMWRAYVHKYIHFSEEAQREIDKAYNNLFTSNDNVLGIQCRGTDYTKYKPKAHPVQPDPEMAIEKAEQLLREKHFNKIFLATEDGVVFKKFKDYFGDLVVSSDETHVDYDGVSWINGILPSDEQEKLKHGMNYLVSMAMLTRCNGFMAGKTSGSIGVMLLSKGFDYTYIWDLGFYD